MLLDVVFMLLDTSKNDHATGYQGLEIMTPDEVAKVLKVTPETVRKWLRKGELTGCDTPAGWRITRADIDAWLNRYRRAPKNTATAAQECQP